MAEIQAARDRFVAGTLVFTSWQPKHGPISTIGRTGRSATETGRRAWNRCLGCEHSNALNC